MNETNTSSWSMEPNGTIFGLVLTILFFYLFVRHAIFSMMILDAIFSQLRNFRWFPGPGKRLRAFVHWLIALGAFIAFLVVGGSLGWIEFVPRN